MNRTTKARQVKMWRGMLYAAHNMTEQADGLPLRSDPAEHLRAVRMAALKWARRNNCASLERLSLRRFSK